MLQYILGVISTEREKSIDASRECCGLLRSKREVINNFIFLIADHHSIAFKFYSAAGKGWVLKTLHKCRQHHKVDFTLHSAGAIMIMPAEANLYGGG